MVNPQQLFFLAMTSHGMGRDAEAISYYDRAVARMDETWPNSPEQQLYKGEASQLLGIEN